MKYLDLTKQTDSKHSITSIGVCDAFGQREKLWIKCGAININRPSTMHTWNISACVRSSLTDIEHSTPKIFRFPIVGLSLDFISDGGAYLTGYVSGDDPQEDGFHIPENPDFNPFKDAEICKDCPSRHRIGEFYIPPHNETLYQELRGRRLNIHIKPL